MENNEKINTPAEIEKKAPVKKVLTKSDKLKIDLMSHQNGLKSFFKTEEMSKKFMASCLYLTEKTPKLFDVERPSLINAFISCAEFGLFPGISGEAYILPYGSKAQFQLGYQGMVTLLYKAGVSSIYADIVKEKDVCKITAGTDPKIIHEYALGNRGKEIGCYVVVELNGKKIWKYMSSEEILVFKGFSQSANAKQEWQRKSSPWDQKNDPELNMWKKTVLKQVAKLLPKTPDLLKAIDKDNEAESFKNKSNENFSENKFLDRFEKSKQQEKTTLEDPSEELKEVLDGEKVEDGEIIKVK